MMTPRIEISEEKKLIGMRLTMSFQTTKSVSCGVNLCRVVVK